MSVKTYKIVQAVICLVLIVNLIVGIIFIVRDYAGSYKDDDYSMTQSTTLYRNAMEIVHQNYIEEEQVTYKKLTQDSLKGMLSNLGDEHSYYIPPVEHKDMQEMTKGEFGGIGIHMDQKDGRLRVRSFLDNSPALKSGVKIGDVIIKVEDIDITEDNIRDADKLIKGEPGTKVNITFYRKSEDRELTIGIIRDIIKVKTVKNVRELSPGVYYVLITQFNEKTHEELIEELVKIRAKMRGLIIDLRNNPGGLLTTASEVAGLFIDNGKEIVRTVPRDKSKTEYIYANSKFTYRPAMAILINGNSASGAEIVAGCLKDYEVATLVGEKTYGKGSVQSIVPLEDKSALRLTIAKYYTPNNYVINKKGISPNVEVKISKEDTAKLFVQLLRPDLEDIEKIEDIQLNKALDVVEKKLSR